MEPIIHLFLHQWQRKLVAILAATIIWISVNHTIIASKTVPSVPVRVVNLPVDKTIQGLLPNGFLSKRMTLTLTGTKDIVEQLEPGDLEVIVDVSNQPNEGMVQITKKNIVSLNPNINLLNHVTSVNHPDFVLKMSPIVTEKVPITIERPTGNSPEGYELLNIWPIKLVQTITGPQEQILNLKSKGLELTFNLNEITKEQLDLLKPLTENLYDDEISFPIPDAWKKISIPFLNNVNVPEPLNDPEAKNLQIDFLRKRPIEIKSDIPIRVFYPLKYSETINPQTFPLLPNDIIQEQAAISVLKVPLFAYNVSKLFIDVVKDNIEIDIVAAPKAERDKLEWGIVFIDDAHLENTYVAFMLNLVKTGSKNPDREKYFRGRFRTYMQKFTLYLANQSHLDIDSRLEEQRITIQIPHLIPLNSQPKVSNAR